MSELGASGGQRQTSSFAMRTLRKMTPNRLMNSKRKSTTSTTSSSDARTPLSYYVDEFLTAHSVSSLDSLSRFVLPLLFVAFNLTYFKYYLDVREEQKQQNSGIDHF